MVGDARLILIVDDDRDAALLQRRRLERAGFRVQTADDVETAMQSLGETDRVDLIVMDYRLGATTGLDLNRRIRAAGFDVPVILVSGAMSDTTVIEAMRAGVRDVVIKNVDFLEQLPDAVRGVLAQTSAQPVAAPRDHRRAHILIVEHDEDAAAQQRRELQRAGYEVAIAIGAHDARSQLHGGDFGLLILDLRLDGATTGLDLFEELKAAGRMLPAILVTAFADQAVTIRALRSGIRDFVPKTADYLTQLPGAVDRVLEQVRVERRLVESELRLASIIGTTMDAIVMCDEHGSVVLFNQSAESMFGASADTALGRPVQRLLPALSLPATDSPAGTLRSRVEIEGVHSSGERIPIEVSVSDVVVHGKRLFTVIARDISERKRTEQELRDADRRKDVFLGMLAHELRNPLAAITTAGEILDRQIDEPSTRRLVDVVRRQSGALTRMVDDLLDVSRVTMGKIELAREPVVLNELVTHASEGFRDAAATAGIRLGVELPHEAVWVNADTTRIEQVIANLLTNALKFTPSGGTITVRTGVDGGDAILEVRDTGTGIDAALLPRIFDLFVQGDTSLDRARSGLGIGLALVRQVVLLHGGSVTAQSDGPGTGARFTVRLPQVVAPADAVARATAAATTRGKKILIVDDQPDLADLIALLAGTMGHDARALYSGEEALTAARAQVPDVMFVDIGMPLMNGYEVARKVREDAMLSGVRLIALTGYGREEDRVRVLEAGFDIHLTKPISEEQLRQVLEG